MDVNWLTRMVKVVNSVKAKFEKIDTKSDVADKT